MEPWAHKIEKAVEMEDSELSKESKLDSSRTSRDVRRSEKNSTLIKWQNLARPERAVGRSGDEAECLRTRK